MRWLKNSFRVLLSVLFIGPLTRLGWGQDLKEVTLARFDSDIEKLTVKVAEWAGRADAAFYLGLAIMVLGGVVAVFQLAKKNWVPAVVGVLGILVAVVTAVKEYKYAGDAKVLSGYARQGSELVEDLKDLREQFRMSTVVEERDEIRNKFATRIAEFTELRKKTTITWNLQLGMSVYAQTRQPAWVASLPSDPRVIQRVGRGEASSLNAAKLASFDDGIRQLAEDFPLERDPKQVRQSTLGAATDYLARQTQKVDTYFEFDGAKGAYVYYTWLRLDRQLVTPEYLPRALVQNSVTVQVPASGTSKAAVPVSASNPRDGSFVYHFSITRRPDAGADLRLTEVDTIEDGSPGSARWYFDILVDGQPRISLPNTRYDDSPATRLMRISDKTTALPAQVSTFKLTVSGYRSNDYK